MGIVRAVFRGKSMALDINITGKNNYKHTSIHLRKFVKRKKICKAERKKLIKNKTGN